MNTLIKAELHVRPIRRFAPDIAHTIQLFLSDWLSSICHNDYSLEQVGGYGNWRIIFASNEDAVIVKLTDLPTEFSKHIDLY